MSSIEYRYKLILGQFGEKKKDLKKIENSNTKSTN